MKKEQTPLCKCGCGKEVKWGKQNKRWNVYINNHCQKGKKHSKETREKISKANKGRKLSKETREKISKSQQGKKHSKETREKISKSQQGKKHLVEIKKKMSIIAIERFKNSIHPMLGKHHSEETKKKMSIIAIERLKDKENHPMYNPNLTDEERKIKRNYPEYYDWRLEVYTRNNFTCQKCGEYSTGNLNAHHIESYTDNPKLRTTVSNGVTLCNICHKDFHHQYGYGNNTREQFKEFINNGKY